MQLNKIQKIEKVMQSNKWLDTKEKIKKSDMPEAYLTLDLHCKEVLDMWISAYLKTSKTRYMNTLVMEKRLPVYMLQFLFLKHSGWNVTPGAMKGALMKQGFISNDRDYNNNCTFNIAPTCYQTLQDFTVNKFMRM